MKTSQQLNVEPCSASFPFSFKIVNVDNQELSGNYHYHMEQEIVIIGDGSFTVTINDMEFAVNKGDLVIIPPGVNHFFKRLIHYVPKLNTDGTITTDEGTYNPIEQTFTTRDGVTMNASDAAHLIDETTIEAFAHSHIMNVAPISFEKAFKLPDEALASLASMDGADPQANVTAASTYSVRSSLDDVDTLSDVVSSTTSQTDVAHLPASNQTDEDATSSEQSNVAAHQSDRAVDAQCECADACKNGAAAAVHNSIVDGVSAGATNGGDNVALRQCGQEAEKAQRVAISEAVRSEQAGSDEAARVEQAGADESARAEYAGADEAARVEQEDADEAARAERAGADEAARAEQVGADDAVRAEHDAAIDAERVERQARGLVSLFSPSEDDDEDALRTDVADSDEPKHYPWLEQSMNMDESDRECELFGRRVDHQGVEMIANSGDSFALLDDQKWRWNDKKEREFQRLERIAVNQKFVYKCLYFDINMIAEFGGPGKQFIEALHDGKIKLQPVFYRTNQDDRNVITAIEDLCETVEQAIKLRGQSQDYATNAKRSALEIKAYGQLLTALGILQYEQHYATYESKVPPTKKQLKVMNDIIRYILCHYKEQITLNDLAAIAKLQPTYLCRAFKEYTHKPPLEYVNAVRMEEACRLLRETEMPISKIVFEVGYRDPGFFSRQFKKYTSLNPRDYRKQYHEGRKHRNSSSSYF